MFKKNKSRKGWENDLALLMFLSLCRNHHLSCLIQGVTHPFRSNRCNFKQIGDMPMCKIKATWPLKWPFKMSYSEHWCLVWLPDEFLIACFCCHVDISIASDQVPLIEDLEQIFMRSWRESHLSEIRQYQQAIPQAFPQVSSQITPVTSTQLPWLAGLAASSCNDSVHIIECNYSLAEGLSEMFKMLVEGKLVKTNYVVIICACRNRTIDSCIAVTGELLRKKHGTF